jgi:NAD(P)-dependent dehydrogenase (short-subunit alcohol dehydrogenase family)
VKAQDRFSLGGKVAMVTGAAGVLGSAICRALAAQGVRLAVSDVRPEPVRALAEELTRLGAESLPLTGSVLDKEALEKDCSAVLKRFGRVDLLLNYAGGNNPKATVSPELSFFDIPKEALEACMSLNLSGTLLPCQVFGKAMAEQKEGVILNIASMSAFRPLTRVLAYSAAKAAVCNFTQWLAVHLAQQYSPRLRVNAIAPGFFLTDQNRYLLVDKETGRRTARGEQILAHTPMGRYGEPDDLTGTILWLLSPASAFVTGVVVPVDGGFSAFSGV